MLLVLLLGACVTYYQKYIEFNRSFENGNLEKAKKLIEADKKGATRKGKFLYFTNFGTVLSMMGDYEGSNAWFEKAYLFGEDYRKNYVNYAISFLSNPKMEVYPGEDHEHLLVPYYKAINYLKLGDFESALVEARRMDIRLNQFSDKYKSKTKFQEDAFIDLLIGLIYDASKDYNNAFIAYRNAYNTYENEYKKRFGVSAPDQLKRDLLRTAKLSGFDTEVEQYERDFRMKTPDLIGSDEGRVLFIWHNGLGPIKDEWAINFVVVNGAGGMVSFQNEELGLFFDFPVSGDDQSSLNDLRTLRVVFPKYVERELLYTDAAVQWDGGSSNLYKAEPVNDIARQLLKQRMVKEMSESLLRVAIKKAAEEAIRQESEELAVAASIFNMATEQADTRNWTTLPHTIYYTWIEGKSGKKNIQLKLFSSQYSSYNKQKTLSVDIEKGRTKVMTYHSLEISPRYNPAMGIR